MKKIVGIIGSGMIGRDPFDERSWSGSSKNFFNACNSANILYRAFGIEVNSFRKFLLSFKHLSFNKQIIRKRLNLDVTYYNRLTELIKTKITAEDLKCNMLQIGAIYDVPQIINGRTKCYSYHDGNIAEAMKSNYLPRELSRNAIKAYQWEKKVYAGLDKIFTMSEYLKRSMIDNFDINQNKVFNIGVGTNFPIPTSIEKDYSKKNIVFIGINFYGKGGDILLTKFKQIQQKHKDAFLHIVGPKSVPKALKRHPIKNVTFHGFLSNENPMQSRNFKKILKEGTIGVHPTRYDAFGIAVLEMMAYGIPCISVKKWAFPEIITPGFNGELYEINDEDDLLEKMFYYLENSSVREQHGLNSRNSIIKNYRWERVAERLKKHLIE